MNEIDELALALPCAYCGAVPTARCTTKAGRTSRDLHDARTGPLWDARVSGYREGSAMALRNAAEEFRRRRNGDRWTLRELVPLVGLDVIANLERHAARWEALG